MRKLVIIRGIVADELCLRPCPFGIPYGQGDYLNYTVGSHLCKSCKYYGSGSDDKCIICNHPEK